MAVINLEKVVRLMDGSEELFRELMQIIEDSLPEKFSRLDAALETQNGEDLEMAAHQFKGALRNVAAEEACALLEKLEKCGLNSDFSQAKELYPQVKPAVEALFDYFRKGDWTKAF